MRRSPQVSILALGALALVVVVVGSRMVSAASRQWTDATGSFAVKAELVEVKDGSVHLKKTDGEVIVVGDEVDVRALAVADGSVVWRREDVWRPMNFAAHAAPVFAGEMLVCGFWPMPPALAAFDRRDGHDVWRWNGAGPGGPSPRATPVLDPRTGWCIVPSTRSLTAVDPAAGTARWTAVLDPFFLDSAPVLSDAGILLALPGHGITLRDRDNGAEVWTTTIDGRAPFPMASYMKVGHPIFAEPALYGDRVLLAGLDGWLRVLDLGTGVETRRVGLGVPVAAAPVVAGDLVVVHGVDGTVSALDGRALIR